MTHADIINLWPSLSVFADDIGVPYMTAKAMRRRGSIPAGYWVYVIDAASQRDITTVSYEVLAQLAAIPREAAK